MLPTLKLLCIPLDARDPIENKMRFDVNIISSFEFPTGQYNDEEIQKVVYQHPLLGSTEPQKIRAYVGSYKDWLVNKRLDPTQTTKIELTYSGKSSQFDLQMNLQKFLAPTGGVTKSSQAMHDDSYGPIKPESYIDTGKAFSQMRVAVKEMLSLATHRLKNYGINGNDIKLARWVNGGAIGLLLQALYGQNVTAQTQVQAILAQSGIDLEQLRNDFAKIDRRMTKKEESCATPQTNRVWDKATKTVVGEGYLSSPNVLIQSGLKKQLISRDCGLVTPWVVQSEIPIIGADDLVIQIDQQSLNFDQSIISLAPLIPTAFRRGSHTHPISFSDIGKTSAGNGGLAFLGAQSRPRYSATIVDPESAIANQIILQANNSVVDPGSAELSEVKELNTDSDFYDMYAKFPWFEQHGLSALGESAVTISAPVEDLVTPSELKLSPANREISLPIYFLEDLWVGYRFDYRNKVSSSDQANFASIHAMNQKITLDNKFSIDGQTEDFWDREQVDDLEKVEFSSTELKRFIGFSSGQLVDDLKFLDLKQGSLSVRGPFITEILGYQSIDRLLFYNEYIFRLRNVFIGGVSLSIDEKGLTDDRHYEGYAHEFPFYRNYAFSAGELITNEKGSVQASNPDQSVYISKSVPKKILYLVPSPIDVTTSRHHGLIFGDKWQASQNYSRIHVSDLSKIFSEVPPNKLEYFYDPDVYGVKVQVVMLNGNAYSAPNDIIYQNGTYCGLKKHLVLEEKIVYYDRGANWKNFKPIGLEFYTTTQLKPSIRKKGGGGRHERLEIRVPQAAQLEVRLLPVYKSELLLKHATNFCASSEMSRQAFLDFKTLAPISAVAEKVINVTHIVEKPLQEPNLVVRDRRISSSSSEKEILIAFRELDSEKVKVRGYISIDAASTGEVRLTASWNDISDLPSQEQYIQISNSNESKPKSIAFTRYKTKQPNWLNYSELFSTQSAFDTFRVQDTQFNFVDQFSLQCAEERTFLGVLPGGEEIDTDKVDVLDVKDQRRKLLELGAIGSSRFSSHFPNGSVQSKLKTLLVDAPSTMSLSSPNVSHIMPIKRGLQRNSGRNVEKKSIFGFRIYVHRPWFESSIGERLAIGCIAGSEEVKSEDGFIPKYASLWGEDPIDRPGLELTKRIPRANDFSALVSSDDLDEVLYPPHVVGGNEAVIYQDNISIGTLKDKEIFLSVASMALQYDADQELWYCDVSVKGDFQGWCGLALYRHQPHALYGRQLSQSAEWVYAAVLHGDPVSWTLTPAGLRVIIGPIYDPNLEFHVSDIEFKDGVSENLNGEELSTISLRKYEVGSMRYFEGVLPRSNRTWKLVKKRFGYFIGFISLE